MKKSANFEADWFLDGRRRNPPDGFGYGQDARSTVAPMVATVPVDALGKQLGSTQNFYIAGPQALPAPEWIPAPEWTVLTNARPRAERVAEAKRLLAAGAVYPRGCSEFVCAVLGIAHELANDLMGSAPTSIGARPPYTGLQPGDIAGWVNQTGMGHVAVYIGESDAVAFIDVREPGARPRSKNGYYDRELFKSSRF